MTGIGAHDALIIVDPQVDFLPGGALAVADGERIFAPIARLVPRFPYVVATRDWHPPDHEYFEHRGGPWAVHCVQGSPGAAFSPRLPLDRIDDVISKGVDPHTDGYSGFAGTDLAQRLRSRGVQRLFICGLATDYCVKATAIEARREGFEAVVILDAIAAVNLAATDGERAIEEMLRNDVALAHSTQIVPES